MDGPSLLFLHLEALGLWSKTGDRGFNGCLRRPNPGASQALTKKLVRLGRASSIEQLCAELAAGQVRTIAVVQSRCVQTSISAPPSAVDVVHACELPQIVWFRA